MELIKDETIHNLLSLFSEKFGKSSFQIKDYWEADLCAIGIKKPLGNYLLYISSYGKPENTFHLEIEEGRSDNKTGKTVKIIKNISLQELDKVFKEYVL